MYTADIFIEYALIRNASILLEIKEISNNTIIETRDATYWEDIFPFETKISNTLIGSIPSSNLHPEESSIDIEPQRSKRNRIDINFRKDFITYQVEGIQIPIRKL